MVASDCVDYKPGFSSLTRKKSSRTVALFAEGEGFKPPIPERGIPDFESSAIDHSANLPIKREPCKLACKWPSVRKVNGINLPISFLRCFADAKVVINYETAKLFGNFFGFLFSN